MNRPECPADLYALTVLKQFGDVGEWKGAIRVKWILHRELSIQMDEYEFKIRVSREKNKTL